MQVEKILNMDLNYSIHRRWNSAFTQNNPEMQDVAFYVRVLNETDFTVSETYDDVFKPSITGSTTLSITNVASNQYNSILTNFGHIWTLVNPQIEVIKRK